VEKEEVATLYESAKQPNSGQLSPACCLASLKLLLEEEGHTFVDPDASKNHHVRILRIEQQFGQWIQRLLKVHFPAVILFS
jgi:hypothetical protein